MEYDNKKSPLLFKDKTKLLHMYCVFSLAKTDVKGYRASTFLSCIVF